MLFIDLERASPERSQLFYPPRLHRKLSGHFASTSHPPHICFSVVVFSHEKELLFMIRPLPSFEAAWSFFNISDWSIFIKWPIKTHKNTEASGWWSTLLPVTMVPWRRFCSTLRGSLLVRSQLLVFVSSQLDYNLMETQKSGLNNNNKSQMVKYFCNFLLAFTKGPLRRL